MIASDVDSFHWSQEAAASIHMKGTLSPLSSKVGESMMLELKVEHPAHTTLNLDSSLTPFFFSAFRFEHLSTQQTGSAHQEGKQESLLRYKMVPLRAGEQIQASADLLCTLPAQEGGVNVHVRLPLHIPPVQIIDTMIGAALAPPLPLEPLPIALQGEALMLKDLHTPMQIASWQHNVEVTHQHGVPWGSFALLATGLAVAYGIFSWIKRWLQMHKRTKPIPRDAAEEVMLQLDQLSQRKLIDTQAFGAYYSSLIAILRWYLNSRFPDQADGRSVLPPEVRQLQEDLIAYADPVKFGRQSSTAKDCELALAYVKHCVYLVEQDRKMKKKGER